MDKRDKPPWWLVHLSPSIIGMAPVLIALVGVVLVAILQPVVQWIRWLTR